MQVFGLDELNDKTGNTLNDRELTLTLVDGKRSAETNLKVYPVNSNSRNLKQISVSTLLMIIGLAILGGFILNLMPCVLPVLSIKLLSILNHSESEKKRIRISFLASAAGIVFTFITLGLSMIVLKASGMTIGWGIQFQQPSFLIAMTILLMAFAFNLWGLFEFRLPFWISRFSTSAENINGIIRLIIIIPNIYIGEFSTDNNSINKTVLIVSKIAKPSIPSIKLYEFTMTRKTKVVNN